MCQYSVVISVGGRWHLFDLAVQLDARKHLRQIVSSFLKFKLKKYSQLGSKVVSLPFLMIVETLWSMLPSFIRNLFDIRIITVPVFDYRSSIKILESDIFVTWPGVGVGLWSLRRAKRRGAIAVVDCGTSHILYQEELLNNEYKRLGITRVPVQKALIDREVLMYEECDYIMVASSFAKKSFLDYGVSEDKILLVPYGVDTKKFNVTRNKDGVFRVVSVGIKCVRKGTHDLLRAFSELDLPNSELILVGVETDEIKPFLAKYGRNCKSINRMEQDELMKYYAMSSVFVLNSVEDGFGLVVLEAMSAGLPVICSNQAGGAEAIDDGKDGFIVQSGNISDLKEKIKYLYENDQVVKTMGNLAQQKSENYTLDIYGERIDAAYRDVLRRKTGNLAY